MERRELDRVTIYFSEIKIFAHRLDVAGGNMVGCAPDTRGGVMLIAQRLPMRPINQGDDTARCFGRTAVIFTRLPKPPHIAFNISWKSLIYIN